MLPRTEPKDRKIPFGRYENSLICDVPTDYLRFIIEKGIRKNGTNWAAVAQAELTERHDENAKAHAPNT